MTTTQIAKWAKEQFAALDLEQMARDIKTADKYDSFNQGNVYYGRSTDGDSAYTVEARVYLGSSLGLDPCGRYHHMLSPNGVTSRCIAFWDSLERQVEARGMWLTCGDGDPLDQFAGMSFDIDSLSEVDDGNDA